MFSNWLQHLSPVEGEGKFEKYLHSFFKKQWLQLAGSLAIDRKSAEQYLEQRDNAAAEFSSKLGSFLWFFSIILTKKQVNLTAEAEFFPLTVLKILPRVGKNYKIFLLQVVCEILADSADGSSSIPVHQFSHIFSFLANRYELSLHTLPPLSCAQTLVAYV
jgi:hypothetical protein